LDKYKNSEISTIVIEIIYAICKEYFGFIIPVYYLRNLIINKNKLFKKFNY